MRRLIVKADDFGLSDAVSIGILLAHKNGIVKNTGMMVNMPSAINAARWIKHCPDLCLGLHVNIVVGQALADRSLIPHLINPDGTFVSSAIRRRQIAEGQDPFLEEEVFLECGAQVDRFIQLNGKLPEYIEGHAVMSDSIQKAIKRVAENRGITILPHHQPSPWATPQFKFSQYDFYPTGKPVHEYLTQELKFTEELNLFVLHPGFVDHDLTMNSSLTMDRTLDYALVTSPEVIAYFKQENIEIISFRDV